MRILSPKKASFASLTASFPALDSPLSLGYFRITSSGGIRDLSMLHDGRWLAVALGFIGTARGKADVSWLPRAANVDGSSGPPSGE